MKYFFVIVLVGCILGSCAQSNYIRYHNYVNEAEYSFFNQAFEEASELYTKAFQKVDVPFEDDIYFYAVSLWQVGRHDESIQLLEMHPLANYALMNSGYFEGMDSELRESILQVNEGYVDSVLNIKLNDPITKALDSVLKLDAQVRRDWREYKLDFPEDTNGINILEEAIQIQDEASFRFLDSIGFLDFSGAKFPENSGMIGMLLIHRTKWVSENRRVLKKAIKKGQLAPVYYARPYDYHLVIAGDTLTSYGQWGCQLPEGTPEQVFKRSVRMGVSPYYVKYIRLPKKKGVQPEFHHIYYGYYRKRKGSFSCY